MGDSSSSLVGIFSTVLKSIQLILTCGRILRKGMSRGGWPPSLTFWNPGWRTQSRASHLLSVGPPFPTHLLEHAVLEPASIEQHDEQRQPERRQNAITKRKVRLGNAPIEPDQRPHPKQGQHPSACQPLQAVRVESCAP